MAYAPVLSLPFRKGQGKGGKGIFAPFSRVAGNFPARGIHHHLHEGESYTFILDGLISCGKIEVEDVGEHVG